MPIEKENTTAFEQKQISDVNLLEIRLNTERLLEDIKMFLSGKIVTYYIDENTGRYEKKVENIAEPKANNVGIHELLYFIKGTVNEQTVQGNFTDEQRYEQYVYLFHIQLLEHIWNNMHNWGIQEDNLGVICTQIMNTVELFVTRLLFNKERESYGGLRYVESNTVQQNDKKNILNKFGLNV